MNLAKWVFEVLVRNFLGFLVHHQGIEVDRNKAKVVLEATPPQNKKELQSLIGKINSLRIFIANFVGKMKTFSPLLKLKTSEEMIWGKE